MAQPSLEGCREKQRRGMKHLRDLNDAIAEWVGEPGVDPKPYEISGEFRLDSREYVFTGKLTKPLDQLLFWGVIFGDAIHNLRSALDHLVWQLVLLNGKTPSGANQFPICDTGANYWSAGWKDGKKTKSTRERDLEGVSDAHKTFIDEMQPYRTRIPPSALHALSSLRDLSNHDKHRFLHLTAFAADFPSLEALDNLFVPNADAGERIATRFEALREDRETEVFAVEYSCPGPNPDVSVQGEPTFGIGISESRARFSHFQALAGEIGEMIEVFAPDFPT
jgi:hypothetical protein